MKIEMIKFDNFISPPTRAHYNDSGADVYATEDIWLWPKEVSRVPLGFGLKLPDGYDAVVHCKSGLGSKGILAFNAPIDAGYTGEVHAILLNTTSNKYFIRKGEKVGQLVIRPVVYADFVDDLSADQRGNGAFGSTGV